MYKQKLFLLVIIIISYWFFYFTLAQSTAQGIISLKITWLGIRHGTPENFPIWTITASPSDQEISWHFTDYFRVEDIQWYATWHYTTIQCDGIYGPSNTKLTWIEIKAGNTNPELIMGLTWPNVQINTLLANYTNILEPVTYIYKETNTNHAWIVNKYGDKPRLKILIPPAAPAGIYSGTIVFSFYMN